MSLVDEQTRDGRRAAAPTSDTAHYGEDLAPGTVVGSYVVEQQLSRGGFATIYRGHHLTLKRSAALKVLHQFLVTDSSMLQRFAQEAQAVNLVRHPNIVDIYEFGELPDHRPYFIMEWLPGVDVDQQLRERGAFDLSETTAIMEDLCSALSAAHRLGVVHRDLKASNVVLLPGAGWFEVKLVDFGIAKLVDPQLIRDSEISASGSRLGTPWNMSPEQFLGLAVDERSDIYSLGILIYQMLTGRLPFRGETPAQLEELHLYAQPPNASDLAPVSRTVDLIIHRCLEKERERRYQKVSDVLHDLRRLALQQPAPTSAARLVPAAGIKIEFHLESASEASLAALASAHDQAVRAIAKQRMDVVSSQANALFAVTLLVEDSSAAREVRHALVEVSLTLLELLSEHADAGVTVSLSLHTSPVVARIGLEATEYVAGDLLCLTEWSSGHPRGALVATRAMLEGLDARFLVQAIPGHPEVRRILGQAQTLTRRPT